MKAAFLLVFLLLIASIPAYAGPNRTAVCALLLQNHVYDSPFCLDYSGSNPQLDAYYEQKAADVLGALALIVQMGQGQAAEPPPAPEYVPALPPPGNPPIGSPWCRSLTIQGSGPTASLMCLH